jgi:hypothetical protein
MWSKNTRLQGGQIIQVSSKNYHNKSSIDKVYIHYGKLFKETKWLFELHFELQEKITTNVNNYPNFGVKKLGKE